jgi:hypothetical protein
MLMYTHNLQQDAYKLLKASGQEWRSESELREMATKTWTAVQAMGDGCVHI